MHLETSQVVKVDQFIDGIPLSTSEETLSLVATVAGVNIVMNGASLINVEFTKNGIKLFSRSYPLAYKTDGKLIEEQAYDALLGHSDFYGAKLVV